MAFLKDDDYILLMDINPHEPSSIGFPNYALSDDALLKLRDVGCQTAVEYFYWSSMEREFGTIRWDDVDEIVSRPLKAGMKVVLSGWNVPLQCAPPEWYARSREGKIYREILSFWNDDAQDYAHEFYQKVIDRYKGENVMVAMCEFLTGESVLWNEPVYYDDCARSVYDCECGGEIDIQAPEALEWLYCWAAKHYVDTQGILVKQHGEIWEDLQLLIGDQSIHNLNYAQPRIQSECRQAYPDATYTLVQYTYFAHGERDWQYVRDLRAANPIKLIVEAQYCDGLQRGSSGWALDHKADGQIVSPLHPFLKKKKFTNAMLDAVKTGVDTWRGSRIAST